MIRGLQPSTTSSTRVLLGYMRGGSEVSGEIGCSLALRRSLRNHNSHMKVESLADLPK